MFPDEKHSVGNFSGGGDKKRNPKFICSMSDRKKQSCQVCMGRLISWD